MKSGLSEKYSFVFFHEKFVPAVFLKRRASYHFKDYEFRKRRAFEPKNSFFSLFEDVNW